MSTTAPEGPTAADLSHLPVCVLLVLVLVLPAQELSEGERVQLLLLLVCEEKQMFMCLRVFG